MPFQKGNDYWKNNIGRKLSEETKNKLSEKLKGRIFSEEHIKKLCEARKNRIFSEETKTKMSVSAKKKVWTEEHLYKIAIVRKNNKPNLGKIGELSNLWKGGIHKDGNGYVRIYKPEHPFTLDGSYVYQHRLVMEKHIGRFLEKQEVIHHINEIRDDNRIENLILFANKEEHNSYHKLVRKFKNDPMQICFG